MTDEKKSNLDRLYDSLVAIAEHKDEERDGASKAISLRLGVMAHMQLERIADRLRDTKHSLAVDMLGATIQDFYDRLRLRPFTQEEIEDWLVDNMGGMFKRIPEQSEEPALTRRELTKQARRVSQDGAATEHTVKGVTA